MSSSAAALLPRELKFDMEVTHSKGVLYPALRLSSFRVSELALLESEHHFLFISGSGEKGLFDEAVVLRV